MNYKKPKTHTPLFSFEPASFFLVYDRTLFQDRHRTALVHQGLWNCLQHFLRVATTKNTRTEIMTLLGFDKFEPTIAVPREIHRAPAAGFLHLLKRYAHSADASLPFACMRIACAILQIASSVQFYDLDCVHLYAPMLDWRFGAPSVHVLERLAFGAFGCISILLCF